MSSLPKFTIIFAGEETIAEYLDGTISPVKVRAMPVRHLGRVLQLADHEPELLEFLCLIPKVDAEQPEPGRESEFDGWQHVSAGWADNLTPSSHARLVEMGGRLNFPNATSWATRQLAAKKMTGTISVEAAEAIAPQVEKLVGLLTSSQKPSGSPAAPSAKS